MLVCGWRPWHARGGTRAGRAGTALRDIAPTVVRLIQGLRHFAFAFGVSRGAKLVEHSTQRLHWLTSHGLRRRLHKLLQSDIAFARPNVQGQFILLALPRNKDRKPTFANALLRVLPLDQSRSRWTQCEQCRSKREHRDKPFGYDRKGLTHWNAALQDAILYRGGFKHAHPNRIRLRPLAKKTQLRAHLARLDIHLAQQNAVVVRVGLQYSQFGRRRLIWLDKRILGGTTRQGHNESAGDNTPTYTGKLGRNIHWLLNFNR